MSKSRKLKFKHRAYEISLYKLFFSLDDSSFTAFPSYQGYLGAIWIGLFELIHLRKFCETVWKNL